MPWALAADDCNHYFDEAAPMPLCGTFVHPIRWGGIEGKLSSRQCERRLATRQEMGRATAIRRDA